MVRPARRARHLPARATPGTWRTGPAVVVTSGALAAPALLYGMTLLAPPTLRVALAETADASALSALSAYALDAPEVVTRP